MLQTLKQWLYKKPTKILLGVYIFYVLFSYIAINPLAKRLVPWIAEKQLASQASVGQVRFNPFILIATIDQFRLKDQQGAPLAGFDQLKVDLELSGIFNLAWKFKEINLRAPQGLIAIDGNGKLNWDDLIAKLNEDKSPPSDTMPRVAIAHLVIQQGQIRYKDSHRAKPFVAELTPLNFELDGFSTLPKDRGDYLIAAKFANNGGTLKWKGNMGVNPVASKGDVALEGIALPSLLQIVKDSALPFKVQQGQLQAHFGYDLTMPNDQPRLALNGITAELNALALTLHASNTQGTQGTSIALAELTAKLPQLTFAQQQQTQLTFEQLAIEGQQLRIQHGEQTLLNVPNIAIQNIGLDLAKHQATIAQIQLKQGAISAKRARDGSVDWQTAFTTPEEAKPTETTTVETKAAETTATETTPKEATPFAVNIAAVQLQDWSLNVEDQTYTDPLSLNVEDIDIGFSVHHPERQWSIQELQTQFNAVALKSTAFKKPVATLKQIALSQGDISIDKQQVAIASIVLSGLKSEVIQPKQGPLNWLTLLENKAPSTSGAKQDKQQTSSDWAVSLGKLVLTNSQIHIEDQTPSKAVQLDLEKIGLELRNVSLNMNKAVPVNASFSIKQGGQFSTQGTLTPAPFKSTLNLKLSNAAFSPFAPYINQYAKLQLASGAASVTGKVSMQQQKAFALNFDGGFQVRQLALNEESSNAPFLTWEQLASENVAFSLSPNKLHLGALKVQHPAGKFIIHEDRTTNLSRILRSADSAAPAPIASPTEKAAEPKTNAVAGNAMLAQAATAVPKTSESKNKTVPVVAPTASTSSEDSFPVTIETTRIQDAELEFADLSLTPQFGTKIHSLNGVINNISTNPEATAQLELDGKVDEYGAAKIRGALQPFKATEYTDVKLAFTNLEMNRLTPYSGKFAGRRIDSGKLSVDLEYKIKQRQLAGENKFVINKLILGERVDSKEAADLPLDLAIAILEDSDGVIDLDLPISGSLDDPQFSYGSIVWKAIKNVLTKIVTSPFRALGKLFGGSADNLDAIVFEAGNAALAPPEQEKLKAVGEALGKRLGLALSITPGYDIALDTRAIQEQTLRRKVAEEMGVVLEPGQKAGPIDLTNPKVQKAIDALHDDLTKKGLLKRLASKFEKPEAGHYETAQEKLTLSIEVKESDLLALAQARGEAIQASLTKAGVDAQRIHIAKATAQTGNAKSNATQTKLGLEVNKQAQKTETNETKTP
ncbi:DUF748 domain-containing protein [Methylotenera sp. 1P/1]|uniref:DUF748 domain-containing protein n=1 Tax=Methylotenera sp. 1P/1 TaxID=1131551 RepID=UPI000372A957|nr:DUF748 domain-containing protein [Methylotenera sp. 1P/1]